MLDYVIIEARRLPQNELVLTKRLARNQRITVGRTDAADLVLSDDPEMSSVHFMVAVSDDECTVTDQNSTNKTLYNGQPVTQFPIGNGERVLCGKTEFTFQLVFANDDPFFGNPFVGKQNQPEPIVEKMPDPVPESTAPPISEPRAKPVPAPRPIQPPARKPTPPVTPTPSVRTPPPPVTSSNPKPDPLSPVDSADVINWGLFAEDNPVSGTVETVDNAVRPGMNPVRPADTGKRVPDPLPIDRQAGKAENRELEKTRVMAGPSNVAKIVRVVIGVTGQSSAATRLTLDPHQNSQGVIGRADSSDLICSSDPSISSRHFSIEVDQQQCLIRDLQSSNGTMLNGQKILAAPLSDGDQVCAGQTHFEIAIETSD